MFRLSSSLLASSNRCAQLMQKSIVHRYVIKATASKKLDVVALDDCSKSKPDHVGSRLTETPSLLNEAAVLPPKLPEDAPNTDNNVQTISPSKLTNHYSSLAKFRLTGLVVCSAVTGYAMAPLPTDMTTLTFCLLGTALTSASANTINQFFEVPFDSQMARTSNRVLVRGLLRYKPAKIDKFL